MGIQTVCQHQNRETEETEKLSTTTQPATEEVNSLILNLNLKLNQIPLSLGLDWTCNSRSPNPSRFQPMHTGRRRQTLADTGRQPRVIRSERSAQGQANRRLTISNTAKMQLLCGKWVALLPGGWLADALSKLLPCWAVPPPAEQRWTENYTPHQPEPPSSFRQNTQICLTEARQQLLLYSLILKWLTIYIDNGIYRYKSIRLQWQCQVAQCATHRQPATSFANPAGTRFIPALESNRISLAA